MDFVCEVYQHHRVWFWEVSRLDCVSQSIGLKTILTVLAKEKIDHHYNNSQFRYHRKILISVSTTNCRILWRGSGKLLWYKTKGHKINDMWELFFFNLPLQLLRLSLGLHWVIAGIVKAETNFFDEQVYYSSHAVCSYLFLKSYGDLF